MEDILGVPCLTFRHRRHALDELLLDAGSFPDREYISQGPQRLTFDEHQTAVELATRLLRRKGVEHGSPVLLYGANCVEWVVTFWAALRAGAVVVLGNSWWSPQELEHVLATTDPIAVVGDGRRLSRVPPGRLSISFDEVASMRASPSGVPETARGPRPDEDDPALIQFTSGTTGLPKGATLSHRGLLSTLQSLLERTNRMPVEGRSVAPPRRSLLSMPLFHIGGLQQVLNPMVTGGSVVFAGTPFDPANIVELLDNEGISVWTAVPTMVSRVLEFLEVSGHPPVDSVQTIGMGGSPVPEELRRRAIEWFPNARRGLAVTYGLSEACGVVATGAGPEVTSRPGSVGRPLSTATIAISEPNQRGEGEILVRSPSVMLGYWLPPERRAQGGRRWESGPVSNDRWLHTGDIGRLDADGFLYVTDRIKDIVIRGGENIATPHVEGRISEHPAVSEVAVIGLPHPTLGEEVAAVVVLRPGLVVTAAELSAFAAETLAYFEVPSRWWLRSDPLPQNTTGKVLKRALREQWLDACI